MHLVIRLSAALVFKGEAGQRREGGNCGEGAGVMVIQKRLRMVPGGGVWRVGLLGGHF